MVVEDEAEDEGSSAAKRMGFAMRKGVYSMVMADSCDRSYRYRDMELGRT